METWVFLGKEWDQFSLLRQLARVFAKKKQCTWVSVLPFSQCVKVILVSLFYRLKLIRVSNKQTITALPMTKQVLPLLMIKFFFNKWFVRTIAINTATRNTATRNKVIVLTDNPHFHTLIDALGPTFTWVYIRPACPRCAQQVDRNFDSNDAPMIQKATLIINDNQLNDIPEKVLSLTEKSNKVHAMPTPPLVPGSIKKEQTSEKVVGFYGAMDHQIDIDLISQSAMALPTWTFELHITYGKVPDVLQALPNVKVKKAVAVPEFFAHWDIALLPYSKVSHRYCYNPPMLIDYIRHGLTVVSTALPVVTHFSSFVIQQRPKETFANTLRQAMNTPAFEPPPHVSFDAWWDKVALQLNDKLL